MTKNTLKIYVCLSNPTAAKKWESPKKRKKIAAEKIKLPKGQLGMMGFLKKKPVQPKGVDFSTKK